MTSPTRGGRRDPLPHPARRRRPARPLVALLAGALLVLAACGGSDGSSDAEGPDEVTELVIGGIPDQDPERLQRQFGLVADHLSAELGIAVSYQPVAEYDAAVAAFRVGDLQLGWFGGLTGVQARLEVPGAVAIAQRDVDARFTSSFVVGADTGIGPIADVDGLSVLAGTRFTFGSDSSTSGRLMPQHFLDRAGVSLDDFDGEPGFSGSHDATIELVEAGTFEAGALSSLVWDQRVEEGAVDTDRVVEVFRTPEYPDYHWVARPELGDDLIARIQAALLSLDPADPDDAAVLDLFGAGGFIETDASAYDAIEAVARDIGKIR